MSSFTPANTQFVMVAFEGPDEYSRAGGLAVRVRDLAETLAAHGFTTHLFFVGDPTLPSIEERGNLILHRWSQWISAHHPDSVYDGEWGKLEDFARSLPPYLSQDIVLPAASVGKLTVLMGEDWQTVPTMIGAVHVMAQRGLLPWVVPVWTGNNIFGFHGIPWDALQAAATPMTVSRYMKHEMRRWGVDPLVTPNGIAPSSLVNVPSTETRALRKAFGGDLALFKIGRFSPDKRWIMALEAVAILKVTGSRTKILLRGDKSSYGNEVLGRAYSYGLSIENLSERYWSVADLAGAIAAHPQADVLNLTSFLPDELLPVIYAAADGVLANSSHEPFGLVGLEVMAAGGLAVVGSTGEDYAQSDYNALVLDTDDPREIVIQLRRLQADKTAMKRIKKRAKETAREWVWPAVIEELFMKLEYVALARHVDLPT